MNRAFECIPAAISVHVFARFGEGIVTVARGDGVFRRLHTPYGTVVCVPVTKNQHAPRARPTATCRDNLTRRRQCHSFLPPFASRATFCFAVEPILLPATLPPAVTVQLGFTSSRFPKGFQLRSLIAFSRKKA